MVSFQSLPLLHTMPIFSYACNQYIPNPPIYSQFGSPTYPYFSPSQFNNHYQTAPWYSLPLSYGYYQNYHHLHNNVPSNNFAQPIDNEAHPCFSGNQESFQSVNPSNIYEPHQQYIDYPAENRDEEYVSGGLEADENVPQLQEGGDEMKKVVVTYSFDGVRIADIVKRFLWSLPLTRVVTVDDLRMQVYNSLPENIDQAVRMADLVVFVVTPQYLDDIKSDVVPQNVEMSATRNIFVNYINRNFISGTHGEKIQGVYAPYGLYQKLGDQNTAIQNSLCLQRDFHVFQQRVRSILNRRAGG